MPSLPTPPITIETPSSGASFPGPSAGNQRRESTSLTTADSWRFLTAVARRWGIAAAALGLICGPVAGLAAWYWFRPHFEATAQLLIEDRPPVIAFNDRVQSDSRKFAQTQVELMRSPLVLGEVLANPSVASFEQIRTARAPLPWLRERLTIEALRQSEVFAVSFVSRNPDLAALIANEVMDSYTRMQRDEDRRQAQRTLELLEQERDRHHTELQRLQENVRLMARRASGRTPSLSARRDDASIVLSPWSEDERRMAEAQVARQKFQAQLKNLQEAPLDTRPPEFNDFLTASMEADERVAKLQDGIARLESAMRGNAPLAATLKPDDAARQQLLALATARRQLAQRSREILDAVTSRFEAEAKRQRQAELARLKQEIEQQRNIEQLFRSRIDVQQQEQEQASGRELDLELARAELARADEVYQLISDKVLAMRTEMRAPDRVRELHRATPPAAPTSSSKSKILAALLAGGFLPWAIALAWEHWRRPIVAVDQVRRITALPVLGELVSLPHQFHRISHGPYAPSTSSSLLGAELYRESVDALRLQLALSSATSNVRVMSIASAVSGEGKTTLATQLAVSLAAASGKPVLLVDGDLRAPDLHDNLGVNCQLGLVDVLEGTCTVEEAIIPCLNGRLHLLPAGRLEKDPHALVVREAIHGIFRQLKDRFQYVVVDGPPILAATEGLILAKEADGTVLCTLRDRSRECQFRLAEERLHSAGVQTLGAVVAGVPAYQYGLRYGSYEYARRAAGSEWDADQRPCQA